VPGLVSTTEAAMAGMAETPRYTIPATIAARSVSRGVNHASLKCRDFMITFLLHRKWVTFALIRCYTMDIGGPPCVRLS
jgi:hypothetical protein